MTNVLNGDALLQSIATGTIAELAALPAKIGRLIETEVLIRQIVSDRLDLASEHLRIGDSMLLGEKYREAISRFYYAMYHAGRSVVFGFHRGDNYQKHSVLPNHLPPSMIDSASWTMHLDNARFTRNRADYDLYPRAASSWQSQAVSLSVQAAEFVAVCEEYAVSEGLV
ncbi:hypothetical protein [Tsukamurella sp. NPDC003166]|uniref:hypothetical protein n=1 Tax=Tsukamurella sp. NPDC003166 TaxID=3154444 RepID=UPI0033A06003